MGFYTTDTLEAAPPRRTSSTRACDGVASERRRARRDPVRSRKPLRGPTRGAISGYRYYSPRLGRWINRDPIEENGGGNLVVFVENDPIYRFDGIGLISRKTKKMICLFINALGHLAGGQIGDPLTWGEIIEDPSTDILDPKNLAPTRITPPQSSRSKIYYPKKLFRGKCGGHKMRSGGCIALELTIDAFAREIGYAGIDWSDWRLPTVRAKCQPFGLVNYWECSCPEGYNLTGASSLPDASYFLILKKAC